MTPVAPHPARHPPVTLEALHLAAGRRHPAASRQASRCALRPTRPSAPRWPTSPASRPPTATPSAGAAGCELVCVLGGDGTILRGAELSRGTGVPLLGVNLGHVGFLAEAEREDLDATVERIVTPRLHRSRSG